MIKHEPIRSLLVCARSSIPGRLSTQGDILMRSIIAVYLTRLPTRQCNDATIGTTYSHPDLRGVCEGVCQPRLMAQLLIPAQSFSSPPTQIF